MNTFNRPKKHSISFLTLSICYLHLFNEQRFRKFLNADVRVVSNMEKSASVMRRDADIVVTQ